MRASLGAGIVVWVYLDWAGGVAWFGSKIFFPRSVGLGLVWFGLFGLVPLSFWYFSNPSAHVTVPRLDLVFQLCCTRSTTYYS